jgi:hypothetical protein
MALLTKATFKVGLSDNDNTVNIEHYRYAGGSTPIACLHRAPYPLEEEESKLRHS